MQTIRQFFSLKLCLSLLIIICGHISPADTGSQDSEMYDYPYVSGEKLAEIMESALSDSSSTVKRNELVILLHGFGRTKLNMSSLKKFLRSEGYHTATPNLKIMFGSLEDWTEKFEQEFSGIQGEYDRIHFVGHSFGGLVIRLFLSRNQVPNLGRCVLLATPNKGTELAGIVNRYLKPLAYIFRPYQDIRPGGVEIPPPLNNPPPEIGTIAGNRKGYFLGRLIRKENDGRVPVDSVPFDGMKEFIVLPYGHVEMLRKKETAILIHRFLQEGSFGINSQ